MDNTSVVAAHMWRQGAVILHPYICNIRRVSDEGIDKPGDRCSWDEDFHAWRAAVGPLQLSLQSLVNCKSSGPVENCGTSEYKDFLAIEMNVVYPVEPVL